MTEAPRKGAGVLLVLGGVFFAQGLISFLVDAGETQAMLEQLAQIDPNKLTSQKLGSRFFTAGELAAQLRLLLWAPLVIYGFVAAVMVVLWRWSARRVLPAMILGACVYAATQVATVAVDPRALLSGWPLRLVSIGLFWWGFRKIRSEQTQAQWPKLRPIVGLYAALVVAVIVLGMWARAAPGAHLVEPLAVGAIAIFFLHKRRDLHAPALSPRGLNWHDPAVAAAAFLGLGIFMKLWLAMLSSFGLPDLDAVKPLQAAGYGGVAIFVMLGLLPAVIEELTFRGVVFKHLEDAGLGPAEVVAAQALLFSALHLAPAAYLSHFVMGATLGWLRLRSGTVYPSMLVHLGWNLWVIAEVAL